MLSIKEAVNAGNDNKEELEEEEDNVQPEGNFSNSERFLNSSKDLILQAK